MTNTSIISGSAIEAKAGLREQLARDVAEFQANGGEVQKLKPGETGVPKEDTRSLKRRRKPNG